MLQIIGAIASIIGLALVLLQWGLPQMGITLNKSMGIVMVTLGSLLLFVGVTSLLFVLKQWINKKARTKELEEQLTRLEIGGTVTELKRITQAAVGRGEGAKEGNIRAFIEVVFNPMNPPVNISRIDLVVFGKPIKTDNHIPGWVEKGDTWSGFFEIPQEFEMSNTVARICAYIGSEPYWSLYFPISFEKQEIWNYGV